MEIQRNKNLTAYNTFGISSVADRYSAITRKEDLIPVTSTSEIFILGGGSNMLLSERLDRWVWHNQIKYMRVDEADDDVIVEVGAGFNWHELVRICTGMGWGGIENLALIPGKVGAAPVQNIGAYGVELKDVFISLEAFHLATGKFVKFDKKACSFGYRNSIFKGSAKGQYFITSIKIKLNKEKHQVNTSYYALREMFEQRNIEKPTIQQVFDAVVAIRSSKLPDPNILGNSGSFFKNPIVPMVQFEVLARKHDGLKHFLAGDDHMKIPAGYLIEACGWKGKREGSVGCYEKQALVIVNHGGATAGEVRLFVDKIKASVYEKFEIKLEEEVNVIQN